MRWPGLPAARDGLRIGLLGGSFNPPHAGHRQISLMALKRLGLDAVWWLVTPGNPLKSHADLAPLIERIRLAEAVGVPGLPDFLTKERAIAIYEERTGHRVRDFDWYFVFGALRFMIISTRTSARAVAYGQMEAPASPDELLINRKQVEPYVG